MNFEYIEITNCAEQINDRDKGQCVVITYTFRNINEIINIKPIDGHIKNYILSTTDFLFKIIF